LQLEVYPEELRQERPLRPQLTPRILGVAAVAVLVMGLVLIFLH
jgi:hypothetical protein